jgi:hypothetical protein
MSLAHTPAPAQHVAEAAAAGGWAVLDAVINELAGFDTPVIDVYRAWQSELLASNSGAREVMPRGGGLRSAAVSQHALLLGTRPSPTATAVGQPPARPLREVHEWPAVVARAALARTAAAPGGGGGHARQREDLLALARSCAGVGGAGTCASLTRRALTREELQEAVRAGGIAELQMLLEGGTVEDIVVAGVLRMWQAELEAASSPVVPA